VDKVHKKLKRKIVFFVSIQISTYITRATENMAQYNPLEIRYLDKGRYYSYDDELYHKTFPEEWATSHELGTGPKSCKNCQAYGHWNGVFIGYCTNCAVHVYEGTRGCGFFRPGKEIENEENSRYVSAFDTYLKDVNLDEVGDIDFCDSGNLRERQLEVAYFEKLQDFCERNEDNVCACLKEYGMCKSCGYDSEDDEKWRFYSENLTKREELIDEGLDFVTWEIDRKPR